MAIVRGLRTASRAPGPRGRVGRRGGLLEETGDPKPAFRPSFTDQVDGGGDVHCCKLGALTIQNSFKISAEPKLRLLPPPQLEICCGIIKSSQTHEFEDQR